MKDPRATLTFSDGTTALLYITYIEVVNDILDVTERGEYWRRLRRSLGPSKLKLEAQILMPPTSWVDYPKSLTDRFTLAGFIPKYNTIEEEEISYDSPCG